MGKKLNIGLIGAGMIGDVHIENIRRDGRADVPWIAARTEKTLQAKMKKHHIDNGTLDYREMLKDGSLDAVIIASPPHTHLAMLKDSLVAGKNVMLEKPMVPNRQELDELVAEVEKRSDLLVLECSCRHARLQPKFRFIKQMIDEGKLGEVYHIHHNHLMRGTFIEYNPAGAWAHQKKLTGGGPFIDWGVYDMSFHLGVLNDVPQIKSVRSFARNGLKHFHDPIFKSDVEEHGAAFLEFDTGLTYYYERGSGVPAEVPNETRIYGTKGSVCFAFCSWDSPEVEFCTFDEDGNETTEKLIVDMSGHSDDNFEITKHFLDCLIDGAEPQMTVQLAAKHLDILFQILAPNQFISCSKSSSSSDREFH
jgi:predicted dehydrogenase